VTRDGNHEQQFEQLKAGDHLALFYNSFAEQMAVVSPFFRHGLGRGERCVYVANEDAVERVTKALSSDLGVAPGRECEPLLVLPAGQFVQTQPFDAEATIKTAKRLEVDALAEGFSGLRFAIEMTWVLGSGVSAEQVASWEALTNLKFFPGSRSVAIFQYHRRRITQDIVYGGVLSHPMVFDRRGQIWPNLCYELPGAEVEKLPAGGSRVDWMLGRIRRAAENAHSRLEREQAAREAAEAAEQRSRFLAEASLLLNSSLDLKATLNHITQLATSFLADCCVVDTLGDDGKFQRAAVAATDSAMVAFAEELWRRHPPEESAHPLLMNVLSTGRSVMLPEMTESVIATAAASGLNPLYADALMQLSIKSLMVVPLTTRERIAGAITFLTASSGRHYRQDDLVLAEALARPASLAIENARLFRETERQRREAVALEAVAREITSSPDQSEVFQRIVDKARELCRADLAFFATYDASLNEAAIRAESGTHTSLLSVTFKPGVSLSGKVLITGEPLVAQDFRSDRRFDINHDQSSNNTRAYLDALINEGVVSKAAAPVRFRGMVTGVLWVAQRSGRRFSNRDTSILIKLADQAAIALENSQLHVNAEQLAVQRERVRVAGELHDALSQLLFSVALKLDWCMHKLGARSQTRGKLEEIRRDTGSMMTHIRRLISELSQDEGQSRTIDEKVRALVAPFRELTGVAVEFTQNANLGLLGEVEQKVLYNAIQEGLANVAKHARASRARVSLELRDNHIQFEVSDDGVGLPPEFDTRELIRQRGHFGLRQMQERLGTVGGWLDLGRQNATGFRVIGAVPVRKANHHA
jgi:signal transduction histidine kinase/Sec-independent protein translocase protein TatA